MSVSGLSAAAMQQPPSQQLAASGQHRHGAHRMPSLSDIDAQGSSVMSPPSATGKIGSKINITA